MKAWIAQKIAQLILNILGMQKGVDFLIKYRRIGMAADLVNNHFDIAAPWPECVATGNLFLRKWDFFNAAQFLIKCKTETVVAIFNDWYKNPKISFKPQALMALWLTAPPFAAEMENIIKVVDLVVITNKPLLNDMMTKMASDAIISYMDKTQSVPLNATLATLPPESLVPIMVGLRAKNPDKFEFRMGKLPPAVMGLVRGKIREVESHVIKMKNFEKADTLLGKLIPPPPVLPPPPTEPAKPAPAQTTAAPTEKNKDLGHDHGKPSHHHKHEHDTHHSDDDDDNDDNDDDYDDDGSDDD